MSRRESKKHKMKPWQRNLVAKHDYNKGGFHGDTSPRVVRREAKHELKETVANLDDTHID